jgi:hypothetical protein
VHSKGLVLSSPCSFIFSLRSLCACTRNTIGSWRTSLEVGDGLVGRLLAHAHAPIGVRALYSPSETSRAFSSLELVRKLHCGLWGLVRRKVVVSGFSIVIFTRYVQLEFDEGPLGPFLVGSRRRGFIGLKPSWALRSTVSLKIQRSCPTCFVQHLPYSLMMIGITKVGHLSHCFGSRARGAHVAPRFRQLDWG